MYKICTTCKEEKSTDCFYKHKGGHLGIDSICKICNSKRSKAYFATIKDKEKVRRKNYYVLNKDKESEWAKEYYEKNKKHLCEYGKRYREKNWERRKVLVNDWIKNHPEFVRNRTAAHRASKLERMPSWADKKKIKEIYKQAKDLSEQTGLEYHVDHEIPLRGENVSGLHVHYNLKILLAEDNLKKSNKFDV